MKWLLTFSLMLWASSAWAIPTKIIAMGDITVLTPILIDAADTNRTALSCTNNSTTTAVRWGSSAANASTGQRIPSGASIEIQNTGAVYMASEDGITSVIVSCTKEEQ